MSLTAAITPLASQSGALDRLAEAKPGDVAAEKERLRKATKELEAFFMYYMLKTMRQTIPENALTKDTPMAGGMGKDTFTDLFDMAIGRKAQFGGRNSISELLYNSMEKLIDARSNPESVTPEMKPLRQEAPEPFDLRSNDSFKVPSSIQQPKPLEQQIQEALPLQTAPRRVTPAAPKDPIVVNFGRFIDEAAEETKIDSTVIASVIRAESGGDPRAVSKAGAKGLMQLIDGTASDLNVRDVFDPRENIKAGSRYLRQMLDRFGDLDTALAAYNAGPGNVEKYGGVPPFAETKNYVRKVNDFVKEAASKIPERSPKAGELFSR
jgi:Rod binding domain-containing protein